MFSGHLKISMSCCCCCCCFFPNNHVFVVFWTMYFGPSWWCIHNVLYVLKEYYFLIACFLCNAIRNCPWLIVGFIFQLDTWIQMNVLMFQHLKNVMKNLSWVISCNNVFENLKWQALYDFRLHFSWIWVTSWSASKLKPSLCFILKY